MNLTSFHALRDLGIKAPLKPCYPKVVFWDSDYAIEWFTRYRWPRGVRCLNCRSIDVNITTSRDDWKVPRWRCYPCNHIFSLKTDTYFHNTKLPLHKSLAAIYILKIIGSNMTGRQLARHIDCHSHAAYYWKRRIEINEPPKNLLRALKKATIYSN